MRDTILVEISEEERMQRDADLRLASMIRQITGHGNDAMVKRWKDVSLVAYEIKMNKISG